MKRLILLALMLLIGFKSVQAQESVTDAKVKPQEQNQQANKQQRNYDGITVMQPLKGIHVVKIDTNKFKGKIIPHYEIHLKTNREVFDETKALLVVNAGFFDPKNEQTVSYLIKDYNTCLDPHNNVHLTQNEVLKPHLSKIYNRSEFRILEKNGEYKYEISQHNEKPKEGYKIKHSVQAGPMLLPDLRLEEEFFVLKKDGKIISESASSLKKYARTAIGVKENNIYLLIFTNDQPVTLEEARNFGELMQLEKLMAFDGGGSTSLDIDELHIVSEKDITGRRLKSFLLIAE